VHRSSDHPEHLSKTINEDDSLPAVSCEGKGARAGALTPRTSGITLIDVRRSRHGLFMTLFPMG
jgi:hypothetical protein